MHRLVKVPLAELEAWDSEHDVLGNKLIGSERSGSASEDGSREIPDKKEV